MAVSHRKLLPLPKNVVKFENSSCTIPCRDPCSVDDCVPPLPPLPVEADHDPSGSNNSVSPLFVLMFCALAVAFSVIFCLTISKKRQSNLRNSLRRNGGDRMATQQEFSDEEHGQEDVFHPIWLINRVGLDQSVIDSINVVQYRKDEGLIEGTDCSVCLTEFEDDESLRLLPKCSHAFHMPCIDTWLRSHKNCPLCRAPIVKEENNAQVSTVERSSNEMSSREETPVANNEMGDHVQGENAHNEMRGELENVGGGKISEILEKNSGYLNGSNSGIRVLSDLGDHRAKRGEELEPVRRSFSMDLSSVQRKYLMVANIPIMEHEGDSDTEVEEAKKLDLQKITKGHKRSSSSIYKRVMKSSSFGLSSQKGPTSMKRSYSSSGKLSFESRHSKSQDSILPL